MAWSWSNVHQITLLSHWWVTSHGPHVGKWVVLEFILNIKICMHESFYVWELILVWATYPRRVVHALARGLSATGHPTYLTGLLWQGKGLCREKLKNRFLTYGWLRGMDSFITMGVKINKTKHKNKFMWSIKNQLTRPECLTKLYSLAFHLHHYSPCCHSNDMLILLIY